MKRYLVVALACALMLCACTPQQQTQTQNSVQKGTSQARVDITNGALEVKVSAAIASEAGVNAFHIAPHARGGVVTLTGTVPNHRILTTVLDTVRGVPGVKSVIDRIVVK
jgi:osmotically-inducible protein OsmY